MKGKKTLSRVNASLTIESLVVFVYKNWSMNEDFFGLSSLLATLETPIKRIAEEMSHPNE